MTVEHVRYRVTGDTDAFEAAWARAARSLARSPGCVDFALSRSTQDPAAYVLQVTWASAADDPAVPGDGGGGGAGVTPRAGGDAGTADPLAEVRPWADDVEDVRRYEPTAVAGTGGAVPTLHAWAGGDAAFARLTEVFYGEVLADPLVGPLFAGMDPSHPRHVALWLAEVFGGPARYAQERGGYPAMLAHHLGRGITEPQRRRWVALLLDAADEAGLPDDPELRAAFVGYVEWGTRLALANSRPGADPPRAAPVPRWGWGVAPPYGEPPTPVG